MVAIVEEKLRSISKDDDCIPSFNCLRCLFKSCQSCSQSRLMLVSDRDDPVDCYFVDYGTTETRSHNSVNEVTAIDTNNDADMLYDSNGNLTKWTDDPEGTPVVKEFLWDDLNRLTKIVVDSNDEAIFIYDVNNQQVRKEYDSDDDGDIDGNDETIEFVWADGHVIHHIWLERSITLIAGSYESRFIMCHSTWQS